MWKLRLVQYVAAKWEYGDKKGTVAGIMKAWCSRMARIELQPLFSVTFVLLVLHDGMIWGYVLDSKKRARRAQGVHDAMLKSLLGEAQTYGGDRF